ncbi:MAG: carboxypeptidase regulatory-like domain-containing protein, partial [Vicinamibacterales bacterium]
MTSSLFLRSCTLAILALTLLTVPVRAQTAAAERQLSGIVRHSETHAPLPGVAIAVGGRRTASDRDGRFSLRVPTGQVLIELTIEGYYPLSTTIDLSSTDVPDVELLMVPRAGYSSSVDVVAAPPPASAPSAVAVMPAEVLRTPGALDNVFRTLQTLPGVSAAEEVGSRLSVRGGAPDQNLTMMDGVEIHDPFRLFGLTSA